MLGLSIGVGPSCARHSIGIAGDVVPPVTPPQPDPELGLVVTGSLNVGTFPTSTIARRDNAVFAADFTGLDGSAGGLVAEVGGAGVGAYAGFETDGRFVLRFGDGGTQWPSGTCYAIAAAGVIAGDGTLVCEIRPGDPARARVWWNGALVASNELANVALWAGADIASFMTTSDQVPADQIATPAAFTTASTLRYYADQLSAL